MEIMIGTRTIYNEQDVLKGVCGLNPYERVRIISGIISILREDIKHAESGLADVAGKERGALAREAMNLLKESLQCG